MRDLLIGLATFALGIAAASFLPVRDRNPTAPVIALASRECIRLSGDRTTKYGPGSDVYRARQRRIVEVERELSELNERPPQLSEPGREWCATARMSRLAALTRERDFMTDLIEKADETNLAHHKICDDN